MLNAIWKQLSPIHHRRLKLRQRRSKPAISILIPAYNHDQYITATVESIWSQSYANLEIVAIDDASTDRTFEVLQGLNSRSNRPMKVSRNDSNLGPAITLNRAAALAEGDYLVFFSSDDLLLPRRFEKQVSILSQAKDVQVVFGNGTWFKDYPPYDTGILHSSTLASLLSRPAEEISDYLVTNVSKIFLHTALMRREFFERIGGFDESMIADDWILLIRTFQHLRNFRSMRHSFHNDHVFSYRSHRTNLYENTGRQLAARWQVLNKYTPVNERPNAAEKIIVRYLENMGPRVSPEISNAYYAKVALLYANHNKFAAAEALCNRILQLDPGNFDLKNVLSTIYKSNPVL